MELLAIFGQKNAVSLVIVVPKNVINWFNTLEKVFF